MTQISLSGQVRRSSGLDGRDVRKALGALYATRAADPGIDVMADIVVLLSELELHALEPAQLDSKTDSLRQAVRRIFGHRTGRSTPAGAEGAIEHLRGDGLGTRIDAVEGRARLRTHVTTGPLEDWAGPVAGAGEIEQRIGVSRSTLGSWRARKAVIGLLRGERKLAYPLDQFVDARPVQGLMDVVKAAPDERAAWLWLRQPHPAFDGATPLDELRRGHRRDVAEAAERDFAIERNFVAP